MTRHRTLLLAAVVVPLAIWARWNGSMEPKGSLFHPRPDSLEYAAEAQALARSGEVYLQVGPHRVRPRYPPGWPMLIAVAVRLGVPGQSLWRITALFGAALAWLAAWLAARATAALRAPREPSGAAPLLAGLLAGCVWALTPIAVDLGQTLMSDEPAALASVACLVLTGAGLLRGERSGPWMLAGGLAFGLAAAMRSVVAALLVPPVAVFLLAVARRSGLRAALRRSLPWALGAAIFPALTILVLARSGWPALEWSGYHFWTPQRFDRLSSTFHLRYALSPDVRFPKMVEGRPLSHLELAARILLGWPGLGIRHYLGIVWPALGWLAAIPLLRAARSKGGAVAEAAVWIAPSLLLWTAGHAVVFSLYFYPASRFYLAPLALCLVLFAAGCGLGLARRQAGSRLLAAAAAALVLALTVWRFVDLRNERLPPLPRERTRAKLTRWLQRGDDGRAGRFIPFDPVHAQALGLLTPEIAAGIREWGELPETLHVRRLRANGFLPRRKPLTSPAPGRDERKGVRPGERARGHRR
jgi:4-amino-4-deoxy-L-arabinose transferase-like glycosyltransferase